MPTRWWSSLLALSILAIAPTVALGSWPAKSLSNTAIQQLKGISFSLLVLIVSALLIRFFWNRIARDFKRLPEISKFRAILVVVLVGLVFISVKVVISDIPGWIGRDTDLQAENDRQEQIEIAQTRELRRSAMQDLAKALTTYAAENNRRFPETTFDPAIDPAVWEMPEAYGAKYFYVPPKDAADYSTIMAFESQYYNDGRMVLYADGQIELLHEATFIERMKRQYESSDEENEAEVP